MGATMGGSFQLCVLAVLSFATMNDVVGKSFKLIPVLTSAEVEGLDKQTITSVSLQRHGSMHNVTMHLNIRNLVTFDSLRMNIGYFVRTRTQENWIYNKTFDFCLFLKQPATDRVAALVYNDLKHHGNVPTRCPISPAQFIFQNVTLNHIRLPPYLPETSFGLVVKCFAGKRNDIIFQSKWYGRLKKVWV